MKAKHEKNALNCIFNSSTKKSFLSQYSKELSSVIGVSQQGGGDGGGPTPIRTRTVRNLKYILPRRRGMPR